MRVAHGAFLWPTQVRYSKEAWKLLVSERGNESRRGSPQDLLWRLPGFSNTPRKQLPLVVEQGCVQKVTALLIRKQVRSCLP